MPDSVYLLWLPLGTALIGALAALAGNAISPMFGARSSHKLWLRDKRAERFENHYVMVGRAMDIVGQELRPYRRRLRNASPTEPLKPGMMDLEMMDPDMMGKLADTAALLEMFATPATGRAARDVSVAYSSFEMSRSFQTLSGTTVEDLAKLAKDFTAKAEKVKSMIRAELKVQ